MNDETQSTDQLRRLTEAEQAAWIAREYRDLMAYDSGTKRWIVNIDGKWQVDQTEQATRFVIDAARNLRQEALAAYGNVDRQKALYAFAGRCESARGIDAVLRLTRTHMSVAHHEWDADPLLVNCPNGVVDLNEGGMFRGVATEDRLLLSVLPEYDDAADCPRWEQFIDEIFDGDEATITYVHRISGYWLTGLTDQQTWWLLLGGGSNGKSLFFGTLAHVLGSYARSLPLSAVLASHNRSSTGEDIAHMSHVRFCYVSETIEDKALDDARLKALTGNDTIAVRPLYGNWFDLRPELKLVLSANRPPAVKDSSLGFWRRVKVVPFNQQFTAGVNMDPKLGDKLKAEASGILNWLIRGYCEWQMEGVVVPRSIAQATGRYEKESDHLREFISDCCEVSPDGTLEHEVLHDLANRLFTTYRNWTMTRQIAQKDVLSMTAFGTRLAEKFEKRHTRMGTVYDGLRVRLGRERVA